MSRETWEMIQRLQTEEIELQLVLQCAPLLADLKISNLLIIAKSAVKSVEELLKDSDISCYPLMFDEKKVTLFLYRREKLEAFLREDAVEQFLARQGYTDFELWVVLTRFREKYIAHRERHGEFPHEMGVLLGYPLEDVQGFMEHGGRNYLYSGYWKVYANTLSKRQMFQKFDAAGERLVHLLSCGVKLADIIKRERIIQNG